jgi:2-succinyl-6-hydroxy-2,4-cyclohexadiene-1-carboxylate synthase
MPSLLRNDAPFPEIAFIHGFLGDPEDWRATVDALPPCTAWGAGHVLDLPVLVGYSMGGRLALQAAVAHPGRYRKVVALSAHPGLRTPEEKRARRAQDAVWIGKLRSLPLSRFLSEWYAQPIFKQPASIPARRHQIDPEQMARLLETQGLAAQDDLGDRIPPEVEFIVGSEDAKFCALLAPFAPTVIPQSGHAILLDQPQLLAEEIKKKVFLID